MKNYSEIEQDKYGKYYLNENDQYHRLTGPAIEWYHGGKRYCINNICYMYFSKNYNKLIIHPQILKLIPEYEVYIIQSIKDLIQEYNPEIEILYDSKDSINNLPDFIKDLIII